MHYMLLLYIRERPAHGTPEAAAAFAAIREFHGRCRERGVLVSSAPLAEPRTAHTVRVRDGRGLRTDGPFAETTEWLGGYFVLDCQDLGQALTFAADCPTALDGSVEVRPLLGVG